MIPQVVFFLGDEFAAIHNSFINHLDVYSFDRTNILSFRVREGEYEDSIVLINKDTKETVLYEDILGKIDSIYQSVYTVSSTGIDGSHLSITLVLPPLLSTKTNAISLLFYEIIEKLYILKGYPLTLFCINLSIQLATGVGLNLVKGEESETTKDQSIANDEISILQPSVKTGKENISTIVFNNLSFLKNKLDTGSVPAHLVLIDNQNILGKGINLTEKNLSIVLAEFVESLYQHQVELFNTWRPKTFSFGLSSLFYDFHRIKKLIHNKLLVYNINKSRLLDKSVSPLAVFDWVEIVYQSILNFNDKTKKELENKLEKNIPDSFVLQDIKVEIKEEMKKTLKEHFLFFLQNNTLTLEEKIYILELLLAIKEPPEGYVSKMRNIPLIRYHLLERLLQNSSDIKLPGLTNLVLNKGDAAEQFKRAQEYVTHNKHLSDLRAANSVSDKRLEEIEEEISVVKSKMVGFIYFFHKLFNTSRHRTNESKIRDLTIEKEKLIAGKHSLITFTSSTLIFNLTFDLFRMIEHCLSDLYNLRDIIKDEWDTCHYNIKQIVDYVYHPLFIHSHKWSDIVSTIDDNSCYDMETNSKIAFGCDEFLEMRKNDIAKKHDVLWQRYFAQFDITKELEKELKKGDVSSGIQLSLNLLLIANISPFIHLKGKSIVDKKSSRYLFVNILSGDMNRRGAELKKSLNKFVYPVPATIEYINPYKMISIEINDVVNLEECTSFRGENGTVHN